MKDIPAAIIVIVAMLLLASTCDGRNGIDGMDAVINRINGDCNAK